MASTHITQSAAMFSLFFSLLISVSQAQTPSPTATNSSAGNFAPGVTPPPNRPLPDLNCPAPTQAYCYWEPDIAHDQHYTCWRSWINYISSSNSVLFSSPRSWTKTVVLTNSTEYIYSTTWDPSVSFSTLCDGHPRAPSGATPTMVTHTTVVPLTSPRTHLEIDPETDYLPWPTPPPCKIPEQPCASLSSAYKSMSTGFWSGWYTPEIPLGLWQAPHCTVDYSKYYPSPCLPPASRTSCSVYPSDLTMLYWPYTTRFGDFCTKAGTTIFGWPSKSGLPNTKVYKGVTLTSPTVYMVVGSARAEQTILQPHKQDYWCEPTLSDITMTMSYDDVIKSYWASGTRLQTALLNFNHLNTIPYSVYSEEVCQWGQFRQSVKDDCKTVWGDYHPTLSVPASLTEADPAWQDCEVVQLATVKEFVALGPVPSFTNVVEGGSAMPKAVDAVPTGS